MAHWLFKSEPNTWSWDDQVAAGKSGTEWDGVRNYQARNMMRQMKKGERGFFYHSVNEKQIVGIVEVVATAHPDSTDDSGKWECVNIRAIKPLTSPVSLDMAKETEALGEMVLVNNSRLSVQPVTDAEWAEVLKLAQTKA
ncbi:EVE domain-containing protein [Acuticoccus sp. MNP-M23]|uniref:EVE domain-containing protein n=1 Tax=Acuticoccus sp. MNP-M23 TaxID=3072793 RepID=UPI0028167E79|nr:EVE domain-containing protein [Acuticoccus sp. MNP-M23]WMS44297.1 EVE domain-containing protein [Acuticoccus sp. MNP-M23]